MLIGKQNFNDTGSGYTNFGQGAASNIGGYVSDVQGSSETGFIAKSVNGSASTYYSDYGSLAAGCLPVFGGSWSNASYSGAFQLQVSYSASYSYAIIAARLCFL